MILLLLQYITWFLPLPFFFYLDYVSFYCTLSDIVLPISVSPPFNFPLLCLSIACAYNLSFLILQSHHFILSLLFSKYFLLTTIPDKGLSPKRHIIKFFFYLKIYLFCTWIIIFVDFCELICNQCYTEHLNVFLTRVYYQEEFSKKYSMDPVSCARCPTDSNTKVHKIINRCSVRHPGRNSLLYPHVRIFRVLFKIM